MSDHLTFQRTPSQFAWLIAVPAEVNAWLVADNLPPEKMYMPVGASFSGIACADPAIRQRGRINFGSLFIPCLLSRFRVISLDPDLFGGMICPTFPGVERYLPQRYPERYLSFTSRRPQSRAPRRKSASSCKRKVALPNLPLRDVADDPRIASSCVCLAAFMLPSQPRK